MFFGVLKTDLINQRWSSLAFQLCPTAPSVQVHSILSGERSFREPGPIGPGHT